MSNLGNIIDNLSDLDQLKAYAKAQFNTIIDLNKKNERLEQELRQLKYDITNNLPIQKAGEQIQGSDEEIIAKIQLDMLKKKSLNNEELSLDDARRVDLYTKLLATKKNGQVAPESKLTDEDLLKLINSTKDKK